MSTIHSPPSVDTEQLEQYSQHHYPFDEETGTIDNDLQLRYMTPQQQQYKATTTNDAQMIVDDVSVQDTIQTYVKQCMNEISESTLEEV
jgi:hypothetical protein